jgi:Ca2+-binding EF-hand superfamily protein
MRGARGARRPLAELDQAESDGDGPGAGGLRMIERADADGDGVVTAQELDDQVRARFKAMDTNGDGKVTPEERRAAFQRRRQGDGG